MSGGKIGSIEEGFIARLRKGDCFVFAGRVLQYLRTQDMTAYVQKASKKRGIVPSWAGGITCTCIRLRDAACTWGWPACWRGGWRGTRPTPSA